MKKFLTLLLALLICGTALAEVVAPQVDEAYVEVEDYNLAMNSPIIEATSVTYENGTLTINYERCDAPVQLFIDGKYVDEVGKTDKEPGSFEYRIELTPGRHKIELKWKNISQDDGWMVTVEGIVTPRPTPKRTATPKPTSTPKPAAVKKVTLAKSVSVNIGETVQLSPKVSPAGASTTFTYKSAKASIAKVDRNGLVTGVKEGSTKITVTTANKKKATVTVKVVDPYKPTKVTISQGSKATLKAGDTLQLGYTLSPEKAQGTPKWSTSKKSVATVSKDGLVTAKKAGTAKITVTVGKKKATITITVKKAPAKRVDLTQYLGKKASYAAKELGLKRDYRGERSWKLDKLVLGDYSDPWDGVFGLCDYIYLDADSKGKYSLGGAYIGQSLSDAEAALSANGWKFYEKNPANANHGDIYTWRMDYMSPTGAMGYKEVTFYTNSSGVITRLNAYRHGDYL